MFDINLSFVGIDACRYGWLMVRIDRDTAHFQLEEEFSTIINSLTTPVRILVDMPIGLLSKDSLSQRPCDVAARKFLGKKHSSVFSPPCMEAMYEKEYIAASLTNYAVLGKKLSKQSWNIVKRIREVNAFLHLNPQWRPMVLESHPEMAFMKLNNGMPLAFSKKTKEGIVERLNILENHFKGSKEFFAVMQSSLKLKGKALPDDMVDALGLAVLNCIRKEELMDISAVSLTDPLGNTMGIWV